MTFKSVFNKQIEKLFIHIVDHPLRYVVGSLLSALLLTAPIFHLKTDYSVRIWFLDDDPYLKDLDVMEKTFGNDQYVTLVVSRKDKGSLFNAESWQYMEDLTAQSWQMTDVVRVESLTNTPITRATNDDIEVAPLVPENLDWPSLQKLDFSAIQQTATNHTLLKNRAINQDGTVAIIQALLKPSLDGKESNYTAVTTSFEKMLNGRSHTSHKVELSGSAPINEALRRIAEGDLMRLIPMSLLLVGMVLWWQFRRFKAFIIPMIMALMCMTTAYGLAALIGIRFNNTTSAVPGILLAICLAETIHLFAYFYYHWAQGLTPRDAMLVAFKGNLKPTFLTMITTVFGFLGLLYTPLSPIRDLGLLASFGCFYSWLLAFFFAAPALLYFEKNAKRPMNKEETKDHLLSRFLNNLLPWMKKHYGKTLIVSGLFTLFCMAISPLNVANSNPYSFFSSHHPLKILNQEVSHIFNGLGGPHLIIDSGVAEGVKDPVFLEKVLRLEQWIEKKSYVNQVIGLPDILQEMNFHLHGDQKEEYRLPRTRQEVAEQLFLYSLSLPENLGTQHLLSIDDRMIRLPIMWSLEDSKSSLLAINDIENYARGLGLNIQTSGKLFLYHRMNDYVVETFTQSNFTAIALVALVMMLSFRSFSLGILSLIPNIIPLFFGLAALYFMNGQIDIGTSLVTSICMGIVVDDTIHFLGHYAKFRKQGVPIYDALDRVMKQSGPAVVGTTICLIGGFGLFVLGDFMPNVYFGVLSAMVLLVALFCDLLILPAILLCYDDFQKKRISIPKD
jgi:uncharacterized protein